MYHISLASCANWLNIKCLNVSSCSKLLSTTSVIWSHTGFLSRQVQVGICPLSQILAPLEIYGFISLTKGKSVCMIYKFESFIKRQIIIAYSYSTLNNVWTLDNFQLKFHFVHSSWVWLEKMSKHSSSEYLSS